MVLVAGIQREILTAIRRDDQAGLADRRRFAAHLSLGAGLDPTWLDLFSEAVRAITDSDEPRDFLDARSELDLVGVGVPDSQGGAGGPSIERVDRDWIETVARLDDSQVDRVAGRWIDLLGEDLGDLPREEKPWIRQLTSDLVAFCRSAHRAPDILFAWSL